METKTFSDLTDIGTDIDSTDILAVRDVSESVHKKATISNFMTFIKSSFGSSTATASNIMLRDSKGCSKVTAPQTSSDIAIYSSMCLMGTCATAAATQTKQVYIPNFLAVNGITVKVKFTNGNTFGTVASGSNVIASGSAPKLSVYTDSTLSTLACSGEIIANGERVGENFVNAGGTHTFVWNSTNSQWEDQTTSILYENVGTSSSYRKQTDGSIEQNGETYLPSTEAVTVNFIIPFSTRRVFQYNFSSFSGKRIDDSYEYLYSTDKLICAIIYFYGNTTATGKINWFASGK